MMFFKSASGGRVPPEDEFRVVGRHAPEEAGAADLRCLVSRFSEAVLTWLLNDGELDALLAVPAGAGRRLASGDAAPDVRSEARMRRSVELDQLIGTLLSAEDRSVWLRRVNPALRGRAPLDLILDRGDGLRALRDALREEVLQVSVGRLG